MLAQQEPIGWTAALIVMVLGSLVMTCVGWGLIEIAKRTADGRMGPNAWAGIRTRATASSEEAWLTAHRVAEQPTVISGWLLIAGGVAGVILGIAFADGDGDRATNIWTASISAGATLMLLVSGYGAWKGHSAAKTIEQDPQP